MIPKKAPPTRLSTRSPDDAPRPVSPLAFGLTVGGAMAASGILAAGVLMAALAPSWPVRVVTKEVRGAAQAERSLAEPEEPAPLAAPSFPPAPVTRTVRVVPNPHPPHLGGKPMAPRFDR